MKGCGTHEPGAVQKEALRMELLVSLRPLVVFVAFVGFVPSDLGSLTRYRPNDGSVSRGVASAVEGGSPG